MSGLQFAFCVIMKTRVVIFVGFAIAALCAMSAKLCWDYALISLHVEFARDQVEIFSEALERAERSDSVAAMMAERDYISTYYPSGTKQERGSKLDLIVERFRAACLRQIEKRIQDAKGPE